MTLTELRKLAEAATPGPWRESGCWTVRGSDNNEIAHFYNPSDAAYIAALSPERILAMLDMMLDMIKPTHPAAPR